VRLGKRRVDGLARDQQFFNGIHADGEVGFGFIIKCDLDNFLDTLLSSLPAIMVRLSENHGDTLSVAIPILSCQLELQDLYELLKLVLEKRKHIKVGGTEIGHYLGGFFGEGEEKTGMSEEISRALLKLQVSTR
jgi:hypothetical protein